MNKKAFTLLEVLLVIALISILFVISVVMINPNKQLGNINDASRRSDVFAIYNAINQYRDANSGNLPDGINNTPKSICKPDCLSDSDKIDISEEIEPYIAFGNIPVDPKQDESEDITGYTVYVTTEGRVVVAAPIAEMENGTTINTLE